MYQSQDKLTKLKKWFICIKKENQLSWYLDKSSQCDSHKTFFWENKFIYF